MSNAITYVVQATGDDSFDGSSCWPGGGGVGPKQTISAGLASTASNGTCVVGPGRYVTGPLILDRPLTLVGAGPGETILRGDQGVRELLRICSDDVVVSSLQLRSGSYGILIDNASPVVRNTVIARTGCAISVKGTDSAPTIQNNTIIRNREDGIRLWGTGPARVSNNIICHNGHHGVFSLGSLASVEFNNVFEHSCNFDGLHPSSTNISADPRFAETRSYRLRMDSPFIDGGDPIFEQGDGAAGESALGANGGPGALDAKRSYWYPRLLTHWGVHDALTSDLCPDATVLVMNEVEDLERGRTEHWQDLDSPDVSGLTLQDVKSVWARRVALNLFNEVNRRLPWSILDYDRKALEMLLRLDGSCLWTDLPSIQVTEMLDTTSSHEFIWVPEPNEYVFLWGWCANPLPFWDLLSDVMAEADPRTPLEAVASIIQLLRNLGWKNTTLDPPIPEESHHVTSFGTSLWNLTVFLDPRWAEGDCGLAATLIRELARSLNIPASVGLSVLGRHRGVFFPTLDRMLVHGDDVQRYPLKHYPAHHTLREVDWYLEAAADRGRSYSTLDNRKSFLDWFTYYRDPTWSPALRDCLCNRRSEFDHHLMARPGNGTVRIDVDSDPELLAWIRTLEREYGC